MYNSRYDIIKTAFINNCFDSKEIADIFQEYGIKIQYFNMETIEVPEADYKKVSYCYWAV